MSTVTLMCPKCGNGLVYPTYKNWFGKEKLQYKCGQCNYVWKTDVKDKKEKR